MSVSGWQTLPNVREWSGGPQGCLGMVERPFRMCGTCWEAFPDFPE